MKTRTVAILTIIFLLNCNSFAETKDLSQLKQEILKKICSHPKAVVVAVAYKDLTTHQMLLINEKEMMHAASTIKVPVMIEVFKQAHAGRFNLYDSILVKNQFKSTVDGSLYAMDINEDSDESIYDQIEKKTSIWELTYQMITVSSNLATNLLIDLVGAEQVMETMKEIGINDTKVLRGVEDIKAYRAGKNNETNAYDMMLVMEAIAKKAVVTPQACNKMLQILFEQKFRDKIPRLLPDYLRVANKTGAITEIDHDCAIVYPPKGQGYVLVILTKGIKEHNVAAKLIAEISKMIYDFHLTSPNFFNIDYLPHFFRG